MNRRVRTDATPDDLVLEQAQELEDLSIAENRGEVEGPVLHGVPTGPTEVFSVRLPASVGVRLRDVAEAAGMSPGVFIRHTVMEVLDGPTEPTLTHQQAEELFRQTLNAAAERAISAVAAHRGLNLGPRLVHETIQGRDRRRA